MKDDNANNNIVYRYQQGGQQVRVDLEPKREKDVSWLRAFVDAALFFVLAIITALVVMAAYNVAVEMFVKLTTIFP